MYTLLTALVLTLWNFGCLTNKPLALSSLPQTVEPAPNGVTALENAVAIYRRGEHSRAASAAQTAHLDHIAPLITASRLYDPGLALALDREIRHIRKLMTHGARVQEIEQAQGNLEIGLAAATSLVGAPTSLEQGASQGAWLVLSYSLDGALCLFVLFAISLRRGASSKERTRVAWGSLMGLALAVTSWLWWEDVATYVSGTQRAAFVLAISACIAASGIPVVMAALGTIRATTIRALPPSGLWLLILFVLSASIIFRDAMEVMPTLSQLTRQSSGAAAGFAGAGVLLIVLTSILVTLNQRLGPNLRTLLFLGVAMVVIISAAGTAARTAQDLGLAGVNELGHAQSPWLSIWPTRQSILLQLLFAGGCSLGILVAGLLRRPSSAT